MIRDIGLIVIFFFLGWKAGDTIVAAITNFIKEVKGEIDKNN